MSFHNHRVAEAALYFIGGQILFEHRDHTGAVTKKCISPQAARAAFAKEPFDTDWLPLSTCRYGEGPRGTWLMQKFEPGHYDIQLDTPISLSDDSDPINILSLPMPGLLFLGLKDEYFLWSYKIWRESHTSLFHTPLPNIYPNGRICFGNTHPPQAAGTTMPKAWTVFWEATFSSHLITDKSKSHPANILSKLITLHAERTALYPLDDLTPSTITLPTIIQELTHSKKGLR